MNRNLSAFARNVFYALFLILFAQQAHGQLFHINYINSKLKDADLAMLNQFGKFEANFYNQVFNTTRNDSATVEINLYGRQSEYNKVQRSELNTTFSNGFYSPFENKIFLYKDSEYLQTLLHETSHNLLRYNYRNPPRWLTEGIATLLGYLVETEDHQIMYVPQRGFIKPVRDSLAARTFSFANFFNATNTDWLNKQKAPMLYSTSYSIIYFLINQQKDYLAPILVLMQQGNSTAAAFRKVFGSTENFAQQFYAFYITGPGRRF